MANPSFIYDEGGNAIGTSADKQPPLVIPPEMRNLPNAPSAPAQAPLVMPKGQLPTEGQTMPGQSAAPLNIPGNLQRALRTTQGPSNRSVIPPANNVARPAALAQPQAPGMPTPEQMLNDPNLLRGAGVKDIGRLREEQFALGQAGAKEEAQAKIDQANNLAKAEKSRTELIQKMGDEQKAAIEQHKRDIQESSPFAPTQESAKDVAQLFSLITVAAFGSGGKGKYSGMQTLASLTGAMKGYQAGQKDVYEKDIKAFEENLKVLKTHNDKVNALYEDAMKLMASNKELGLQKIQQLIAEDNTGIITRLARSGQYKQLGEAIGTVTTALQAAQDKIDKRNQEFALLSRRFSNEKELKHIEFENAKTLLESKIRGEKDVAKVKADMKASVDDVSSDLASRGIRIADKKDRSAVESTVNAMANLQELKSQVVQDPSLVGRQGQIRQFTDRYIKSFKGGPAVDESAVRVEDQAALRFSKKYASMLTRYEQALAGSARAGSTVFFQKRYNDLLSQNQFNPAGMAMLMDDMTIEIGREAMTKSPKLTMPILQDMATDFEGRVGDLAVTKPAGQSQQKATPEEIKAYADEHFKGNQDAAKADLKAKGFL